ncbi:hypothetical protein TNCV_1292071 [Trichonephila clavipes]|nr:hypothetical protein TNCV_1292071 [Trichonephila clavipes]
MELRERTGKNLNDGFEWLCRNQSSVKEENHYISRSARKGSWFQLSNMDMCTVLLVMRKCFGRCPQKYAVADCHSLKVRNKFFTKLVAATLKKWAEKKSWRRRRVARGTEKETLFGELYLRHNTPVIALPICPRKLHTENYRRESENNYYWLGRDHI